MSLPLSILDHKYKLISTIGSGGMSTVYLAEHVTLKRKYAIKMLAPHLQQDQEFRDRFTREGLAQAQLHHDNIVQVIDYIDSKNSSYLIMELIDGEALDILIQRKGQLSEIESMNVMINILDALNYAHTKGVIHRDIKPSNIIISRQGKAILIDFGIAIKIGEKRLTKAGKNVGTAWYMSPEQVTSPLSIDHRSDVYSMGIILYEMLTGEVPFDGETDYNIKEHHVRTSPIPPQKKNKSISTAMNNIILKALEKDPDHRFNGCGEFLLYIAELKKLFLKRKEQNAYNDQINENEMDDLNGLVNIDEFEEEEEDDEYEDEYEDDEEEEIEEEESLASEKSKVEKNKWFKFLGIFISLTGFCFFSIYFFLNNFFNPIDTNDLIIKAIEEDPGNKYMDFGDIRSEFSYNNSKGRIFLIKGKVINQYLDNRTEIKLEGKLFSAKNGSEENKTSSNLKVTSYQVSYAGNILNELELKTKEKNDILKYLHYKNSTSVESGDSIPFMIVFFDLPNDIEEYSVQVLSSEYYVDKITIPTKEMFQ